MKLKMVMAIVPRDDADAVLEALIAVGLTATFTDSRGGMLRQAQETLFIAVPADRLQTVLDILRPPSQGPSEPGSPVPMASGGFGAPMPTGGPSTSVAFIWDIERYEGA